MSLRARIRPLARPATLTVALGALLVPAAAGTAPADAKSSKTKYPVVTSVRPMAAQIGQTLVLGGHNFRRGKNKNTVVFQAPGTRAIFVKTTLGTAKQVRVIIPESLRVVLKNVGDTKRFRLRVLSAGFAKKFTATKLSPVITASALPTKSTGSTGSTGGSTTTPTGSGSTSAPSAPAQVCTGDEDHDMLPASLENQLGLDPCNPDTDGDGVPDGYEYQSARDLNDDEYQSPNLYAPYPGKRPYPNPLFKDDAVDYDGDGLPLSAEYRLWDKYGAKPAGGLIDDTYHLFYSDGEQYSLGARDGSGNWRPTQSAASYTKEADFLGWAGANGYNPVHIATAAPWYDPANRQAFDIRDVNLDGTVSSREANLTDVNGDGWISDDERDEDADGLSNLDELRGAMQPDYWNSCYQATAESPFPISYAGTDLTNPDTDGDGIRDGADDQDHDDIPNVMELSRYAASGYGFHDWVPGTGKCSVDATLKNGPDRDGDGNPDWVVLHADTVYGRVQPFNPCLPYTWSRTCPTSKTFGVKYAPFDFSPWYALQ